MASNDFVRFSARWSGLAIHRSMRFLLPTRVQVIVKERLSPTAFLDHPVHAIRLHADAEIEWTMRAYSCRKEPETVDWIASVMSKGDIIYDIGANVGAYSLLIESELAGHCQVFAFEPGFANFAQLNRNIALNAATTVVPLNVALSDKTTMDTFSYSSIQTGHALHSLRPDAALSTVADYIQPVPTYRLDDFRDTFDLPMPHHIKLDVDGVEHAILRGAENVVKDPTLRSILVEIPNGTSPNEHIAAWLVERGFRLASRTEHGKLAVTANCIFVRN